MSRVAELRRELSVRNQLATTRTKSLHELTVGEVPSVIFLQDEGGAHGNFHPVSYRNICANPEWARRLKKVHTASRKPSYVTGRRWMELDSCNSSDALLMNVFCYRGSVRNPRLSAMLGVALGQKPVFGYKPRVPLRDGNGDRTEIDMKLSDLLIEAKLTEGNFQTARWRMVERYRDFEDVFDAAELPCSGVFVHGYQLIRCVLAANA